MSCSDQTRTLVLNFRTDPDHHTLTDVLTYTLHPDFQPSLTMILTFTLSLNGMLTLNHCPAGFTAVGHRLHYGVHDVQGSVSQTGDRCPCENGLFMVILIVIGDWDGDDSVAHCCWACLRIFIVFLFLTFVLVLLMPLLRISIVYLCCGVGLGTGRGIRVTKTDAHTTAHPICLSFPMFSD